VIVPGLFALAVVRRTTSDAARTGRRERGGVALGDGD
jgi:hypothetical protein